MKNILVQVQSWLFLTIGLAISATGWAGFIVPSKIIGGGATGIATALYYTFGFDIGLSVLVINTVLILIAIKIVGASFGVKTIYGVILFSLFLSTISYFVQEPLVNELFVSILTGAILAGTGAAIVFMNGGSTGGTDIIAMLIRKYVNISLGRLLLYVDVVIISSSFLIFFSIENMVYGLLAMAIYAYTVDVIINGTKQTVQIFVFSKKHQEIAHKVIHDLKRGVTLLQGEGGYSGESVKVLMIVAKKSDSVNLMKTIKSIDSEAFVTKNNVMGVYGEGFETYKI